MLRYEEKYAKISKIKKMTEYFVWRLQEDGRNYEVLLD